MDDSSEEVYEVEAIRAWRYSLEERRREFLVKWMNWDEDSNTWEPKENLHGCTLAYRKFLDNLTPEERRLFDLSVISPEKLNGFQRNAEFEECIGAAHNCKKSPGAITNEGGSNKENLGDGDEEDFVQKEATELCLLVKFKDTDRIERVTLEEFHNKMPDELLAFFEQRILLDADKH